MGDQFLQNYKQSMCLADMELLNNNFSGDKLMMMGFWHDHNNTTTTTMPPAFLVQQDPTTLSPYCDPIIMLSDNNNDHKDRKRKATDAHSTQSSSAYSSPQVSDNGSRKTNQRGKKAAKVNNENGRGDVIHVRAKRGQATDSHSLAERVRRGKINERLRCLQDIVPGCYKTMGMAVMLDEIINYVQSLQNQVEFLSMKLTAATTFNDLNSDTDAMLDAMQRAKAFEALMKVEDNNNNNIIVGNQQQQQFSPLPLNFGPHQHQHPSFLT